VLGGQPDVAEFQVEHAEVVVAARHAILVAEALTQRQGAVKLAQGGPAVPLGVQRTGQPVAGVGLQLGARRLSEQPVEQVGRLAELPALKVNPGLFVQARAEVR